MLCAVRAKIAEVSGRRRARRFSLQLGADVVLGAEKQNVAGELKDISEGGALVLVDQDVDFGAVVRLRFDVAPDRRCEAMGRVLRSMSFDGRRGVAIEFVHTNQALLGFLGDLDVAFSKRRDSFLDYVENVTIEIAATE